MDPNLYSKIEVLPYKPTLHGATSQVYTLSPPPPSYDQTATLYSATTPTLGATITYNPGETGPGSVGNGGGAQYVIYVD